MPPRLETASLHEHVRAILTETGESDPFEAIRVKARAVIDQYVSIFSTEPPFDMKAMASLRSLHWSDEPPKYSLDSEIAPENDRVVIRINKNRPITRQRFSIGHEIGHTLFPEYELAVRCRKTAGKTWADPEDLMETLCDVAASELLFPTRWFEGRCESMPVSASSLASLAGELIASREATIRRFVEISKAPMAAVYFSWKLKPTEKRVLKKAKQQPMMFADCAADPPQPMMRVDYAILNSEFQNAISDHIPKDKSIPSDGPIFTASKSQLPQDGMVALNLGTVNGTFAVHAVPLFTDETTNPDVTGCSVVSVLRPESN